jgi:type I restriction enzyme R subunit
MPHAYTEDYLVEQPAIQLFAELGWLLAMAHPHPGHFSEGEDVCVDATGLFGRETKAEVVLESRLRTALQRLNPSLPADALSLAIDSDA